MRYPFNGKPRLVMQHGSWMVLLSGNQYLDTQAVIWAAKR